ncbi:hypothetical protein NC652_005850 [Populus alba x Populus x berolinensis]|nr:hypothetical protein NC652_005850 [Populus alba x Populus x berolinensis]
MVDSSICSSKWKSSLVLEWMNRVPLIPVAKIQSAQGNRPEILNLMRGFFYWLMNASHAGSRALRPWLDSSCLKVRPQHKKEIDYEDPSAVSVPIGWKEGDFSPKVAAGKKSFKLMFSGMDFLLRLG